jgi:hypothetical protein
MVLQTLCQELELRSNLHVLHYTGLVKHLMPE